MLIFDQLPNGRVKRGKIRISDDMLIEVVRRPRYLGLGFEQFFSVNDATYVTRDVLFNYAIEFLSAFHAGISLRHIRHLEGVEPWLPFKQGPPFVREKRPGVVRGDVATKDEHVLVSATATIQIGRIHGSPVYHGGCVWSLLSFRFPQWVSLGDGSNTRSTCRFNARPHDANPHVPERNKRICARYDQGRASGLSFTELGKETAWARRAAGVRKR
jgi:hypothetical protein